MEIRNMIDNKQEKKINKYKLFFSYFTKCNATMI